MRVFIRIVLLFVVGILSFFIVSTTHGEQIVSQVTPARPTPTFRPFPLFTIRPMPSVTPTPPPQIPLTGFCIQVPVLMYHHIENLAQAAREHHEQLTVDSAIFDQQMKYLVDQGYKFISVETLVNAIRNKQTIPGKSIAVTLDDGYDDAYEYAFPIAKKYGVLLNLMIPTGLMENAGYLQWSQIQTMVSSGQAKVYNHTWSHASLPSDPIDKVISEVTTAQNQLEQRFGIIPKILIYPYGNYNGSVTTVIQQLGYVAAISTENGTTHCESTIFDLHRTRVGNVPLSTYNL